MCAIIDASVVSQVFGKKRPPAGEAFFNWIAFRHGRLIVGGKLDEELERNGAFRLWIRDALLAGKAKRLAGKQVDVVAEDPSKLFALTYPIHALPALVRDIAAQLAGQTPKAVRQLETTNGSGTTPTSSTCTTSSTIRTHSPARSRSASSANTPISPSRATTAALCFDKIDIEKGTEGTRGPNGETRTLKHPWRVPGFQLAPADGLLILHADHLHDERDTPPAEPLIVKLIERQQRDGSATVTLLDEVLMYARSRAVGEPRGKSRRAAHCRGRCGTELSRGSRLEGRGDREDEGGSGHYTGQGFR